jgi:hypothetical protein
MDGYLNFSQRFAKIKSKRLQKAVAAIRGSKNQEIDLADGEGASPPKKRARKRKADARMEAGLPISSFLTAIWNLVEANFARF